MNQTVTTEAKIVVNHVRMQELKTYSNLQFFIIHVGVGHYDPSLTSTILEPFPSSGKTPPVLSPRRGWELQVRLRYGRRPGRKTIRIPFQPSRRPVLLFGPTRFETQRQVHFRCPRIPSRRIACINNSR